MWKGGTGHKGMGGFHCSTKTQPQLALAGLSNPAADCKPTVTEEVSAVPLMDCRYKTTSLTYPSMSSQSITFGPPCTELLINGIIRTETEIEAR